MSTFFLTSGVGSCLALASAWFLWPWYLRRRSEERLAELCRSQRAIVLSYDDGPGPQVTPRLLDVLEHRGVHATFYLLGKNAAAAPDIVRRLVAAGHDIGSHTHDHSNAWKVSPWRYARDVAAGRATVAALGGDGRRFRPPYGKLTLASLFAGKQGGMQFGWWTVDSRDSWDRRRIEDVLAEIETRGGGVVLMHDWESYQGRKRHYSEPHAEHVLQLTRRILDFAAAGGYRVVSLAALEGRAPLPEETR